MKKLYWILCFACLSLSLSVNAQSSAEFCKKYKDDIVSQIKIRADRSKGAVQCKVWPANPELALLAWQLSDNNEDVSYDERSNSDIQIVIASAATGKIISQFIDERVMFNDALSSGGLKLDTARYKLNKSTTAFGLRFNYSNDYASLYYLNLYTFKNNKISNILKNLHVKTGYSVERFAGCHATTGEMKSFIVIQDKKVNNGYASLLYKKTRIKGKLIPIDGSDECGKGPSEVFKGSLSLAFDGTRYSIPDNFSDFLYDR